MKASGHIEILIKYVFFLLFLAFILLLQYYRRKRQDVKMRRKSIIYLTSIFFGIDLLLGFIFFFVK
jgi:preprotein translocase subunit SecG